MEELNKQIETLKSENKHLTRLNEEYRKALYGINADDEIKFEKARYIILSFFLGLIVGAVGQMF